MPARLAAVVLLALPLLALSRPPAPSNPMEKLETAIPHAIKLLESKKYADLLRALVEPDHLKELLKSMDLDEFAKKFAESHAEQLLRTLKEIKDAKPKLEDDGKRAVFTVKENAATKNSITFRRHGKTWHLQN